MSEINTPKTAVRKQREKRIPFGVPRTKLAVYKEIEGYHMHWINDTPGRIFEAQQGGYEFVSPEEVDFPSTGDSRVMVRVGVNEDGTGMNAYLMKIRQDWYEEDQQANQKHLDQIDAAIRGGDIEKVGGKYSPSPIKYKA